MSKLEDLLAANVKATSKLVKNAKGLATDSEAVIVAGSASSVSGQGASANVPNE